MLDRTAEGYINDSRGSSYTPQRYGVVLSTHTVEPKKSNLDELRSKYPRDHLTREEALLALALLDELGDDEQSFVVPRESAVAGMTAPLANAVQVFSVSHTAGLGGNKVAGKLAL